MDGSRFDRIATHIADHRLSRRRMLDRAGDGQTATSLTTVGVTRAAGR